MRAANSNNPFLSSPYNLDSSSANGHAAALSDNEHVLIDYHIHRQKVEQRYIKLESTDPKTGNVTTLVISGAAASRYFEIGRKALKK